jgi:hypothetical protein
MMAKRRRPTPARRAHIKAKLRMWKQRMHDLEREYASQPRDGWHRHCRGILERRIAYWQQELIRPRKEPRMRHVEETAPVTTKEWPWRVVKGSLNLGGVNYAQGSEVADAVLTASRNTDFLVSHGYIRRVPPKPAKQAKPAAPAPSPMPYQPVDHIKLLFDSMTALAAKQKRPIGDVEDAAELLDLKERAIKQFCDEPGTPMSQAWGGNNRPTASGQGTSRRIFDPQAFRKRLYGYGKEMVA